MFLEATVKNVSIAPLRLNLVPILIVIWLSETAAQSPSVIDIGTRRELMIDDYLIGSFEGEAALKLYHPVRREIALVNGEQPWEGNGCGYYTIMQDGDKYRMYYHAWHIPVDGGQEHPLVIAYAESDDGVRWVKPRLGIVEFRGSKKNNIVLKEINGKRAHDFSPFKDSNPDCAPDAVYKAIGLGQSPTGLYAFKSKDAIHWETYGTQPVFVESGWVFDSQNITFWSETEKRYVLYYRNAPVGKAGQDGVTSGNRARNIARATSEDYIHWTKEGLLEYTNRPPTLLQQYYTNQIKPYYRAPHLYIGFPACYVDRGWQRATLLLPSPDLRKQRAKTQPRNGSVVTDSLIMTSRDGTTFHTWDEAFLRPGLKTRHNWAYGDNYVAWHVVETQSTFDDAPRELSLYATESYFTGKSSRLRRYTLRIDGFASVHAPYRGGEVITKPLRFSGSELRFNFATAAAGTIRAEIQDESGKPFDGYSLKESEVLFGDSLDQTIYWKNGSDVGAMAGKVVQLRIVLSDADVYAFRFVGKERSTTEDSEG